MAGVMEAYGIANGVRIGFTHQKGDTWTADVPWTEDGEYTAEIYARDEAGNVGYLCTMLFVISGHEMQGHIVPGGFSGAVNDCGYSGLPTISEFFGELQNHGFSGDRKEKEYQAEMQEGGYEGECVICSKEGH